MAGQRFVYIVEHVAKSRPPRPPPGFHAAEDPSPDRRRLDEIGVIEEFLRQADKTDETMDELFVVEEDIDADQIEPDTAFQLERGGREALFIEAFVVLDAFAKTEISLGDLFFDLKRQYLCDIIHGVMRSRPFR